ncbi:hypothetical protein COLO4_12650 [Corchorus olitorius]|uniref:Peptidase S8/S53 domain-containing protein n=1 Tax=Corchorus olitorius TaxID=93759 RepID=A0A1R3K052_9ROSI|nr:hypothetical protein COLO4_12650 [Corchorus olitorius]
MMKIFKAMLLLLAIFIIAIIAAASVDRQVYIVRLDKAKITNNFINSIGDSKPWHEAVLDSIAHVSSQQEQESEATPPELVYSYETAIFGFAAKLSAKQLESLKRVDGFVSAIPDQMLRLHTTHSPQFLGLEGSKESLWHSSNLQSDVIIGVIDTGIWPEHASFQDHGMPPIPARWKGTCEKGTKFSPSNCNKKLIGARSFYKAYLASGGKINQTEEYLSPRDADGHGTHTASTAAGNLVADASLFGLANGTASGMRYSARIAMYKVLWPGNSLADVLAAMVQAVEDGVDVLSLSLGPESPLPYYQDPAAVAALFAIGEGVFVSFSAGNSGPGKYTATNTAPWIMTVAASTTDRSFPAIVKLGNGQVFEGTSLYTGKATKQLPVVYGKNAGSGQGVEYCKAGTLNPKLVKGKIVICVEGYLEDTEKGELVKLAGGVGMLSVKKGDEDLNANAHILPAASLGASASESFMKYVLSTKLPTASIAFKGTTYGNRAPMLAAFSSRGPNLLGLDVIKPDVTAPGVNILAALPAVISPSFLKSDKRRAAFGVMSGTSMSCPHVSGIAAVLKSKHKNWSPAAIKSALMTTAYTVDNRGKPIADLAVHGSEATPFAMGSGHVDPVKASDPGLIYDITADDYLHYLCSLKYNATQMASFTDDFTCPKKATMQPGDLNYPSFAVNFKGKAHNITFMFKRTVTNVGIPRSIYKVSVEEPNGVSIIVKPNVLRFKKLGQKLSYKVSFMGLKTEKANSSTSSFGSLAWVSEKYKVRSPIALTWI